MGWVVWKSCCVVVDDDGDDGSTTASPPRAPAPIAIPAPCDVSGDVKLNFEVEKREVVMVDDVDDDGCCCCCCFFLVTRRRFWVTTVVFLEPTGVGFDPERRLVCILRCVCN